MNIWKPIALCSVAALVASVGLQSAQAGGNGGPDLCHGQKHMQAALDAFKAARGELDHAEHNKDHWRDRAIQAADTAIRETNTGCAAAL